MPLMLSGKSWSSTTTGFSEGFRTQLGSVEELIYDPFAGCDLKRQ